MGLDDKEIMNDDDKKYILCLRCKDMKEPQIPKSSKRKCLRCGELCYVSSSSHKLKEIDGIICTHCLTEKEMDEAKFGIAPETMNEYLNYIGGIICRRLN